MSEFPLKQNLRDPSIYALFIGGPLAGQQLAVGRGQFALLYTSDSKPLPGIDPQPDFGYIRFDISIEGGTLHYFRPEDWEPEQVVRELITNYRSGAQSSASIAERAAS